MTIWIVFSQFMDLLFGHAKLPKHITIRDDHFENDRCQIHKYETNHIA